MVFIVPGVEIPTSDLQFSFARSGGPGGQNVNKVNSKAILHWGVSSCSTMPAPMLERFLTKYANRLTEEGVLVISSQRYRDQPSNINDCLERLQEMLDSVARDPILRKATKPSRSSKRKRVEQKRQHSEKKAGRRSGNFAD